MHIISGLLRKPTFTKQTTGGMMYCIELSEYQKGKDGEAVYTNYKAAFFPKSQAAEDRLIKGLVEGNFVVVNCDNLKIDVSDCGQYTKLDMSFPTLSNFDSGGQVPQQNYQQPAAQQAPQQNYQQPVQSAPQQQYQQPAPQQAPAPQYNQPQQAPHNPNDPPF